MTRIQRTFRKVAVSALTATTIVVGASVIPLTATTAANAATAVPTSEIISRAVDEAKKQGAAQDYTQTITKPQRKILWVAFSDVTYSLSGRHEKMDANERTYTKTVVDQFAKVMDTRIGVQVSSTLRWVETPFISKDAEGRIHEGDITNVLNQQAALAEYDSIMVISKGNNGGVTLGAYFDDKTTRGSGYSYASLLAPANAAQPGSGYPGPTAEVDYSTEVAIHEFCHQLQFNGVGFPYVDLHDFSIYSKYASGMQFYTDYLTGKVKKDGIAYGTYPKMWAVSQRFLHRPGMATVHYQNTAGQTIAPDANAYGPGGESYDIKARSIAGFTNGTVKWDSAPASGQFATGMKTDITFVYAANPTGLQFLGGEKVDLYQTAAVNPGTSKWNSYTYQAAVPVKGYTYTDRIQAIDGARRSDTLEGVQLNWNANGSFSFSMGGKGYTVVRKSDTLAEVSVTLSAPTTYFTVSTLGYVNTVGTGRVDQTFDIVDITPAQTGVKEPMTGEPHGHVALTWGDYKPRTVSLGKTITLRSAMTSFYTSARGLGSDAPLIAGGNQTSASTWEKFDVTYNAGNTVSLRAQSNGKWVTAPTDGSALNANRDVNNDWEKFVPVINTDGTISLRASNGNYVAVQADSNNALRANSRAINNATKFVLPKLVSLMAGTITLRSASTNFYASARGTGPDAPVIAGNNQTSASTWENFDITFNADDTVSMRAQSNGKWVTAPQDGSSLNANRDANSDWEKFVPVTNADGTISLRAVSNGSYVAVQPDGSTLKANSPAITSTTKFLLPRTASLLSRTLTLRSGANGLYVSARGTGPDAPLVAGNNQTSASTWENFDVVENSDNTVSLRARSNGKWVTAPQDGSPLNANREANSDWEKFVPTFNANDTISLRAVSNNKFVTVQLERNGTMVANSPSPSTAASFY